MGAQGTATVDFGAFPGSSHATVNVTGQASIVSSSLVEAWIRPVATADHTADEHMLENLKVFARDIVAGTGFTIHVVNDNRLPDLDWVADTAPFVTVAAAQPGTARAQGYRAKGGNVPRVYGQWTLAWVWN